jgi:hypothetical protein
MAVLRNRGKWDRSNVVFRGGRIVLYDKTVRDPAPEEFEYIDSGVSILTRGLVERNVPEAGPSDLASLFHALSREGLLAGLPSIHGDPENHLRLRRIVDLHTRLGAGIV